MWLNSILLKIKTIMSVIRTKLGEGGRMIIPAAFRNNLHLNVGDDIILHMQDDTIYITTPHRALQKLQNKVKHYFGNTGKQISLADELITTRRTEAERE
jgi:AbrB family looped-hinge helix DNA binding protein